MVLLGLDEFCLLGFSWQSHVTLLSAGTAPVCGIRKFNNQKVSLSHFNWLDLGSGIYLKYSCNITILTDWSPSSILIQVMNHNSPSDTTIPAQPSYSNRDRISSSQ